MHFALPYLLSILLLSDLANSHQPSLATSSTLRPSATNLFSSLLRLPFSTSFQVIMAEAEEGGGIAEKDGGGVINEDHEEDDEEEGDGGFDHDAFEAGIRANRKKRHRALFGPLPTVKIPLELYKKAKDHQDQLTQEERALFLSRGDLIGKALAQPSSLTVEERNTILERQPLDKERANIELITNGRMGTIAELVSKTLTDVTSLSKNELELVSHNFNNDSPR